MRSWLAGVAVTTAVTLAAFPASPTASSGTQIVSAEFGVFGSAEGQPAFRRTDRVSLAAKESYGWIIAVKTDKPTVHWREEFTLPAKASWGTADDGRTKVARTGKTAVTERNEAPVNGVIINAWSVADGDPTGQYLIKVNVDDAPTQTFKFEVR
jgi:hypothetical protein